MKNLVLGEINGSPSILGYSSASAGTWDTDFAELLSRAVWYFSVDVNGKIIHIYLFLYIHIKRSKSALLTWNWQNLPVNVYRVMYIKYLFIRLTYNYFYYVHLLRCKPILIYEYVIRIWLNASKNIKWETLNVIFCRIPVESVNVDGLGCI